MKEKHIRIKNISTGPCFSSGNAKYNNKKGLLIKSHFFRLSISLFSLFNSVGREKKTLLKRRNLKKIRLRGTHADLFDVQLLISIFVFKGTLACISIIVYNLKSNFKVQFYLLVFNWSNCSLYYKMVLKISAVRDWEMTLGFI